MSLCRGPGVKKAGNKRNAITVNYTQSTTPLCRLFRHAGERCRCARKNEEFFFLKHFSSEDSILPSFAHHSPAALARLVSRLLCRPRSSAPRRSRRLPFHFRVRARVSHAHDRHATPELRSHAEREPARRRPQSKRPHALSASAVKPHGECSRRQRRRRRGWGQWGG